MSRFQALVRTLGHAEPTVALGRGAPDSVCWWPWCPATYVSGVTNHGSRPQLKGEDWSSHTADEVPDARQC